LVERRAIFEEGEILIVSIMQPYFFPYIGYYQLLSQSDVFVINDAVQYIKGGWINRNRILDSNGKAIWITLPVAAAKHTLEIRARQYLLHSPEALRVVRRIENAYFKAPHFREAFPIIKEIMTFDEPNVAVFNTNLLQSIAARLGLEIHFLRTSELPTALGSVGQGRVIEICNFLGATHYINPIGGRQLYRADVFYDHGLSLSFLETTIEPRLEKHPYLSIIHTLMTESDTAISDLLTRYRIIPG
jgi:hypothetical protein